MSAEIEPKGDARSITNDYINQAWTAYDAYRLELGSTYIWKATEVALRCAAAKRGLTVDTAAERSHFAKLLDAENGANNHFLACLMSSEHYLDDSEVGIMPGYDPTKYADLAVEFINELLTMAEAAE